MDTAPWPQEIAVMKPMEEMITDTTSAPTENTNKNYQKPQPSTSLERKVRPQKDQALNCPRCNSTNTKFCYYNNYSLTQPRYFCKTCRRYWTAGGSLRNIPVGGGSRKNKRPNSSSFITSPTTSKMKIHDLGNPNPKILGTQDLNLGFPSNFSQFIQFPNMEANPNAHITQTTNTSTSSQLSALELLNGIASSRGFMTPYMPMQIPDPNSVFPSGFNLEGNFKPTLNFSLDGIGDGSLQGLQENAEIGEGRVLFPFSDLKSSTTTTTTTTATVGHEHHQNHNGDHQITRGEQGDSSGYWNGMLGGPVPW